MSHSSEERHSADLLAVAEQLSDGRHEASALDLDQIKMRAIAQATRGSATLAPKRGRGLMKRRSFLATALVLGTIASGGATTMAVTGGFSPARDDSPSASVAQYISCEKLVSKNRRDERSKARAHRKAEKRIRNNRDRKAVRKINRRDEAREKTQHRADEKRCRKG